MIVHLQKNVVRQIVADTWHGPFRHGHHVVTASRVECSLAVHISRMI